MPLNRNRDPLRTYIREDDPLPPEDRAVPLAESLDDLYRTQRPRLLRLLRRRTVNDSADDLVQQTFLRYLINRAAPKGPIVCPEGYLRQIARNLAVDEVKAARRQVHDAHLSIDEVELVAPDQVAALEARDILHRLETSLQKLKPRTREIFLAHRIDGYSYAEIAARTGLSVKGVEKHMSRAIAHIDRMMSIR